MDNYYGNSYDYDYEDPEPLPAVLRCPHCGCFVSWKPQMEKRSIPSKTHLEYKDGDEFDDPFPVEVIDEWEESTYVWWECKRCQHGTEEPETWA